MLWAFAEPSRLSEQVRELLIDPRNHVAVSAATVWEVEIGRQLGKLVAPDSFGDLCVERGFDALPITFDHATAAGALPRHHDDPFDRMLIAQALCEGFDVVTADPVFSGYGLRVVPAR